MEKKQVIFEAVGQLMQGNLILCPADNFWGICCDASHENAVKSIKELSEIDNSSGLTVLLNSDAMINNCVKEIPGIVWDIIDLHTEPLDLIMDGGLFVTKSALASDGSIRFRLMKSGICSDIMQKFRKPLIFCTHNLSNEKPALSFEEINSKFKDAAAYTIPNDFGKSLNGKAEKVIRIKENGEVKILRK